MATTTPRMKITYATLSADNEELQSAFDAAVERVRGTLGQSYPMLINGEMINTPEQDPVINPAFGEPFAQPPDTLGNKHPSIRQKCKAPGMIQTVRDGHRGNRAKYSALVRHRTHRIDGNAGVGRTCARRAD